MDEGQCKRGWNMKKEKENIGENSLTYFIGTCIFMTYFFLNSSSIYVNQKIITQCSE